MLGVINGVVSGGYACTIQRTNPAGVYMTAGGDNSSPLALDDGPLAYLRQTPPLYRSAMERGPGGEAQPPD